MDQLPQPTWDARIVAIHSLRVNVKSLAAEAKFIRVEEKRCRKQYRDYLRNHRIFSLREEARYAQLALAFVRQKPYGLVERFTVHKPDAKRLYEKVKKHFHWNAAQAQVEAWLTVPVVVSLVYALASVAAEQQGAAPGFQSQV